jgi:hypothetical protein
MARRSPREPHHSHKLLDVVIEMGLKLGRPYYKRRHYHHMIVATPDLNPKTKKTEPSRRRGPGSTLPPWPKGHIIGAGRQRRRVAGGKNSLIASRGVRVRNFPSRLVLDYTPSPALVDPVQIARVR